MIINSDSLSGSEADMSPVSDQQWPQAKAAGGVQERGSSGEVTWQLAGPLALLPSPPPPPHPPQAYGYHHLHGLVQLEKSGLLRSQEERAPTSLLRVQEVRGFAALKKQLQLVVSDANDVVSDAAKGTCSTCNVLYICNCLALRVVLSSSLPPSLSPES